MTKTRGLVVEAIDNLTYFVLFYGIFAAVIIIVSNDPMYLLRAAFMVVPAIVNFLLRRVTNQLGKLIVIHSVLPIVLAIILPNNMMTVVWVIIIAGLALFSVIFAFRKQPTEAASFIVTCSVILIALSLWAANIGNWHLTVIYPMLLTIAVAGRILLLRLVKMDRSLEAMHLSYKQPIDKIIVFDYKLTASIVVALVGISLAIYLLLIAPITSAIFRAIPALPQIEVESAHIMPDASWLGSSQAMTELLYMPERAPSPFWQLLTRIVFGILSLVIIAIILYGIYRFFMFLLSHRTHRNNMQMDTASTEDEREFIRPKARRHRIRSPFMELHLIRRLFKETAKKHIKMGVSIKQSDTPTDIKNRIHSEDISNLAEEYAQVRYKN